MVLIDSSAFVSGLLEHHPNHELVRKWIEDAVQGQIEACICQHGIAEAYAVLSSVPGPFGRSPATAAQLIADFASRVKVIPLGPADYLAALGRLSAAGIMGGAIYEMLHLIAAEGASAEAIVTLNSRDFERFTPMRPIRIVDPLRKESDRR